ncbi:hypothetical protein PVAP13_9KG403057 [Panicum virgatum]|uniref:Uncharacterized protein n=1 Tax=Panicum virgatum TaxID=38727 RepID=A0A8T0NA82_PANVG|nr:hypothetical protein PVAP13_9KG403057 [Panicum virgatum]
MRRQMEVTSAWTGEKKTKIQSTPTSACGDIGEAEEDDASAMIIVQEGPEQLEGLDWDQDTLDEKIDWYLQLQQLNRRLPDNDDDDFWVHCDDKQRREMNQRLALCRIRAHMIKEEHREIDDANLKARYPPNVLEDNGYFKLYENKFDWYFDPQYCNYARFQDYQRLMLRNNGEYEEWEDYRKACSTLEGDQEFVQLWEKLLSNTKRSKIESLVFYHMPKITAELSYVFTDRIHYGFPEFMWSVQFDNTWYKYFAGFYFGIWKRVAKQKAEEGVAYQLIMEAVKKFIPKRKTYYNYAKKKLDIAKEIGLIPLDPYKSSTST